MKKSYFGIWKSSWPATQDFTRERVAYLLRAARLRKSRVYRASHSYIIDDVNLLVCPK